MKTNLLGLAHSLATSIALQKVENWQFRKANVLNDRTDLPDALKYQRKRWKPPGHAFKHSARDKGVQLLDKKQKAAEKRRAALEDDNTGTVQVSTVMIKNGDCKYKTFAKRWRDVPVKDDSVPTPRPKDECIAAFARRSHCRHEIRLIKRYS